MAGIGFQLQRLFAQQTLTSTALAYGAGAALAFGPFLSSLLCIAVLSLAAKKTVGLETAQAFTSAIVYVFGGTLVLGAPLHVILTRYLADQTYLGKRQAIVDSACPALMLAVALVSPVTAGVLMLVDLPLCDKVSIWTLAVTVAALWVTIVLMTAAQCHWTVVRILVGGTLLTIAVGVPLLPLLGGPVLFGGYALAHVGILVLCLRSLVTRLGRPRKWDWGVLFYCCRHPMLLGVGLMHTLGVWIDKFLFWGSELSSAAAGLVTAPKYDSSTLIGFITALPAILYFFVRVEAEISLHFQSFFDAIFLRSDRKQIEQRAAILRSSVFDALLQAFMIQGAVVFVAVRHTEDLLRILHLPLAQIGMLRYAILGSFFYALIMFAVVVLLYLDQQRDALVVCAVFCLSNVAMTLLSQRLGYSYYGVGFALSTLAGAGVAMCIVATHLHFLTYYSFAMLPVRGQRASARRLRARTGGGVGVYHDIRA